MLRECRSWIPVNVLVARSVRREADGVRSFRFERPGGGALESWSPGAHLEFTLPSGAIRHYSLCGDPADRSGYVVAVLEQPAGRGGSREFHEYVRPGAELMVRGPRNHFPLVDAESYLFIAGGIGITPILPMVRVVSKSGRRFRILYGGRTLSSMAFREEVAGYGAAAGLVPEDTAGRIDLAGELSQCPVGTQVYCCGPEPLLRAVEDVCAGDPRVGGVHVERFGAAGSVGDRRPAGATGVDTFEVELARTGTTIVVGENSSILDKVLEVAPDQPWSCREGYCGTCETNVIAGEPEHADDILSDEERASNTVMMICVGRSRSARLVLDI
ncbi:oxidoreductase [Mycobacterium sp. CBMA247]|nr:oxidoreductase [Mycolicibacterium sp. CBMA 329]MUL88007.1 oxidoreductase [Mycolicibacterium sp. CBMA 331]MUM26350.1 oxidoreductase [Mycolicibacterium sp. CBMA 295]MUM38304.1 oxidoreductase [Mycolicibacterium sp. CBMA 247]MUM44072.1 oxidoreductase [Mycolicibacterium sp. CBMA 294]